MSVIFYTLVCPCSVLILLATLKLQIISRKHLYTIVCSVIVSAKYKVIFCSLASSYGQILNLFHVTVVEEDILVRDHNNHVSMWGNTRPFL